MPKGTNFLQVGGYNQAVLLDAVRRSPNGLSQVQLCEMTGLAPQTVSTIVRRLLSQGTLQVAGVRGAGRGKPRTILKVNPASWYAVGIHLDPTIVTSVVCDLTGTVIADRQDSEAITDDPESTIRNLALGVDRILETAGVGRDLVPGVGIAAPGPVKIERGAIMAPRWLHGLRELDLTHALERELSLPVFLDKDTFAAAVGENWHAVDTDSTVLFLYVGAGIGSALSIGGRLARGGSNQAGEIGHLIVDPRGKRCLCGRNGCLGRATDPSWIVADAISAGIITADSSSSISPHDVDGRITELCALTESGDGGARALFEEAARAVGEATRILVSIHDPQRVVVGGPFWRRFEPYYRPAMERALQTLDDEEQQHTAIESSTFNDDTAALGAASLVLNRALSPQSSLLRTFRKN